MAKSTKKYMKHCRLFSFAVLLCVTSFASIAGATYSLPADRSYPWAGNVGVSGDIPARTSIYATLSPSGGDDTTAIKNAISACPTGQVVLLKSGTFTISSPINVKSGITLRGAGLGSTIIKGKSGMGGAYLVGFNSSPGYGSSVSLSGGISKGSTSITTGAAHGLKAGDIVIIDQVNNSGGTPTVTNVGNNGTCTWCGRSSGTRSQGQINKVVSAATTTTATLEMPLAINYASGQSPQITKINGITTGAGIEDLTIDNSASGSSSQTSDGATIAMYGASNCWMLRMEAVGSYMTMIRMKQGYRNTIRSSKFHEGTPATPINGSSYATSRAYGLWMGPAGGNLIENNQFYHLFMPFKIDQATAGNVVSYNYITELYYTNTNWNLGTIEFHGAHPSMNLFESNYGDGRLLADDVWGSSSHNTFFRNRQARTANKTGAAWNVDLHANAQFYNFIGNVLGTSGVEGVYEFNGVTLTSQGANFRLGYGSDGDTSGSGNDSKVASTLLRHANWDSFHKTVVYNGSDDVSLPSSMYLTSKPSWWGNIQYPAVGPDVSPMYPTAPGAGKGTPWGDNSALAQSIPSAPTALAAQ